MRKRTKKRTLVIEIIIVLSNYLREKLPFFLCETILYWEIAIVENYLSGRLSRRKEHMPGIIITLSTIIFFLTKLLKKCLSRYLI